MPTIPEILLGRTPAAREALVRAMPERRVRAIDRAFAEWAHDGQLEPEDDWRTWVLMAGRGFGKTRAGAEWVLGLVRSSSPTGGGGPPKVVEGHGPHGSASRRGADRPVPLHHASHGPPPRAGEDPLRPAFGGPPPPEGEFRSGREMDSPPLGEVAAAKAADGGGLRMALVAATVDEARRVMVEGESGLLACARPGEIVDWSPSLRELTFASGARATLFSGANPEALRGPQHHFAWCDELAKWRHPERTWDMLQLGLRCGSQPRALVTTTPRGGCAALKRILAAPDTELTRGRTNDNPHLPEAFVAAVQHAYGGTRMGREEIDGEWLEDVAGSLWPLALIDRCRGAAPAADSLRRVVVGVDPPASAEGTCGIVVCALDAEGVAHVLADWSQGGLSPESWARRVAAAAEAYAADRVVAEKNQGGDMVGAVLKSAGIVLPITLVSATRGKAARAEPVSGLFEAGKARLAGSFPELEEQLGRFVPGGYEAGGSPDRADAMVWALWALLLKARAEPRVHQF